MKHSFITGLKFKPIELKKHRTSNTPKRKSNRKLYCKCEILENGEFVAVISTIENNKKTITVCSFSPNSYDLKGKQIVFTKPTDKCKDIICIHRSEQQANHFPGTSEQYTPFRKNWIYRGYIVTFEGKDYFDVTETVGHYNAYYNLLENV